MIRKVKLVFIFILLISVIFAEVPVTANAGEINQGLGLPAVTGDSNNSAPTESENSVLLASGNSVTMNKENAAISENAANDETTEMFCSDIVTTSNENAAVSENTAASISEKVSVSENTVTTTSENVADGEYYPDAKENPELDPQWWREMEDEMILLGDFGNGYTHDARYANYKIANGIDVSKYQGEIDWKKVKADGISFAFIRVGFRGYGSSGSMNTDTYYKTNIVNAVNAGIQVGVYFYSQAITRAEAVEEANYTLNLIKGMPVTLPVVMDYEYASDSDGLTGRLYHAKLSREAATDICSSFADTVRQAGYEPMVYANKSMLAGGLQGDILAQKCKIWLAQYSVKPTYEGTYSFWQYSSSGQVNGINGRVDMNFWYQKPTTFRITYDLDGGKQNSKNPKTYRADHAEIPLYAPTKTGYTFEQWLVVDDAGNVLEEAVSVISADKTGALRLRASWRENTYTVYYHAGSSEYAARPDQVVSANYTYTQPVNLYLPSEEMLVSENIAAQKGIVAFSTKPTGGKKYKVSKTVSKLSKLDGGEVHLYACWGTINYGISYDLYGEQLPTTVTEALGDFVTNSNPVSYTYNSKKTLKLKSPKRPGYQFAGWELVSGNEACFDAVKQRITAGASGNLVLKAKWNPLPYRVELKLNSKNSDIAWTGGLKSLVLETHYASEDPFAVTAAITNSSGKKLVAFNTKSNGKGISVPVSDTGEIILAGLSKRKNAKVKLYAIWE